uniref:CHAP domain-containing protein n=1 Tax=candidate division CPR3 bacterium TaxID=2268181 RepID=A0A7C5URM9_UNCC3
MEQKLKDFINKWINKGGVGNTPENKGQCVGLVCVWVDELSLDHIWGNAKDLWKNYNPNQFDFVLNTADAYPIAGDVVVWNEKMGGGYGHTAIATGVHHTEGKATDWFEAFSQNDPTGSPCILKKYSYNNVIGFIRPKKELAKLDDYYLGIDLNNKESIKVCVSTWKRVIDGEFVEKSKYQELENAIANLNQQISDLNAKNTIINDENKDLRDQLKDCQDKIEEGNITSSTQSEQLLTLTQELNRLKLDYENAKKDFGIKEINYQKQIKTLQTKYDATKSSIKKLLIDYIFGKKEI